MKAIDYSHHGSPALTERTKGEYPDHWGERVPMVVRVLQRKDRDYECYVDRGEEYYCWVNSLGAVSAITHKGHLFLKPGEFEVVAWHEKEPTHSLSVPYDFRSSQSTLLELSKLLSEMQPGNLMLVRVEPEGMTAKEALHARLDYRIGEVGKFLDKHRKRLDILESLHAAAVKNLGERCDDTERKIMGIVGEYGVGLANLNRRVSDLSDDHNEKLTGLNFDTNNIFKRLSAAEVSLTNMQRTADSYSDIHVDLAKRSNLMSERLDAIEKRIADDLIHGAGEIIKGHAASMDAINNRLRNREGQLINHEKRLDDMESAMASVCRGDMRVINRLAATEKRVGLDGIIMQRLDHHKELIHDSGSATLKALAVAELRLAALEAAERHTAKVIKDADVEIKYDDKEHALKARFKSGHEVVIARDLQPPPCPKGKFMTDIDGRPLHFVCMVTGSHCYRFIDGEDEKYEDCATFKSAPRIGVQGYSWTPPIEQAAPRPDADKGDVCPQRNQDGYCETVDVLCNDGRAEGQYKDCEAYRADKGDTVVDDQIKSMVEAQAAPTCLYMSGEKYCNAIGADCKHPLERLSFACCETYHKYADGDIEKADKGDGMRYQIGNTILVSGKAKPCEHCKEKPATDILRHPDRREEELCTACCQAAMLKLDEEAALDPAPCPHASPEPTLVDNKRRFHDCAMTGNKCEEKRCVEGAWRECEHAKGKEAKQKTPRWTGDVCPFFSSSGKHDTELCGLCILKDMTCMKGFATVKDCWPTCSHLEKLCPHFRPPIDDGRIGQCVCDNGKCRLVYAKEWQHTYDTGGNTCRRALGRVRVEKEGKP